MKFSSRSIKKKQAQEGLSKKCQTDMIDQNVYTTHIWHILFISSGGGQSQKTKKRIGCTTVIQYYTYASKYIEDRKTNIAQI